MSKRTGGEGIELKDANKLYEPQDDFQRPRTSTAIAR
jgi:sodium/potassium-transporting ATPase subunit alpha